MQSKKQRPRTLLGTRSGGETDAAFDALSHPLRRQLLLSIADTGSITLNTPNLDFSDQEMVSIYHSQLPKLTHLELVEWDSTDHVVTRGRRFETIQPLLDLLVEESD